MKNVRHIICWYGDIFEGAQASLIDAKLAMPEWFPTEPQFDKWGRRRRTFNFQDQRGEIKLAQVGDRDSWCLRITWPDRHAADERYRNRESSGKQRAQLDARANQATRDALLRIKHQVEASFAGFELARESLIHLLAGTSPDRQRSLSLAEQSLVSAHMIAAAAIAELKEQKA